MGNKKTKFTAVESMRQNIEKMNLTDGDEMDGCYLSKPAQDPSNGVDFSDSEDINAQLATQPWDGTFKMEESQGPMNIFIS